MKLIWCLDDMLDLQLFEGDGAGAAASGAGAAAGGETGVNDQAAAEPEPRHPRRVDRNPLAGVKYGRQPEAAPAAQPAEPEQAPADDWNDIRNNRYKEQFDKDVQEIVKKRLGSAKDAEAKLNSMMPMMDALIKKHGLQAGDYEQLSKVVLDDDSLYEEEAMNAGYPLIP